MSSPTRRPDDPAWGLRLCEKSPATARAPSILPLDRLLKAGGIEDRWEDPPPPDRPARRFYSVTSACWVPYQEALDARPARRRAWAMRSLPARRPA